MTTVTHSFFDQGSLDIRGGLSDRVTRSHRVSSPLSRVETRLGMPPVRTAQLSPDILQLTGGSLKHDGAARLALRSNDAPGDLTLEPMVDDDFSENGKKLDEKSSEFGDTPVQLTDMLRERLMELKRDKLQE
uniref:Serine/threonine-protein kinase ATG1 n=1 Tax=Lygus hesperus TaxID=30085 RepID=A0A0A9WSP3_LYGHE